MSIEHAKHHGGVEPILRVVAMPMDTNAHGYVFGGWIMSHVDVAGATFAMKQIKGPVVTVAVNEFHFKEPVYVGDLISLYASLVKIGKTSITVKVEVCAQRSFLDDNCIKVTEATLVFVALDENRNPTPIKIAK